MDNFFKFYLKRITFGVIIFTVTYIIGVLAFLFCTIMFVL